MGWPHAGGHRDLMADGPPPIAAVARPQDQTHESSRDPRSTGCKIGCTLMCAQRREGSSRRVKDAAGTGGAIRAPRRSYSALRGTASALMVLSVWRGGEPPRLPQMAPEQGKRGSYSATYGPPETRTQTRTVRQQSRWSTGR